jgi:hypothetical protein
VQIARGPRGGNAEVFIDGVSQGRIDFFRPATDPSKPDKSGKNDLTFGLTASFTASQGSHTFKLNVLNDKPNADPKQDMIYVDGFVITGGSTEGAATIRESSTETQGTVSGSGTNTQPSSSSSTTLLMTGVLDVPDGVDLDLNLLDPLGFVAAQSTGLNPTEVVRFTPSVAGLFNYKVANKSLTPGSYTLYTITTKAVVSLPRSVSESPEEKPRAFALEQNYPNPFNPVTVIRYSLPVNSYVTLKVYNVLGQEVAVLVDGIQDAGFKSVSFDASRVGSGVYFYKLVALQTDGGQADSYVDVKRMVIMK